MRAVQTTIVVALALVSCGPSDSEVAAGPPIPDLAGLWATEYFGFEPPLSGPGPITNKFRLPNGNIDPAHRAGNDANPRLKPSAAETLRAKAEILRDGRNFPEPSNQCAPQQPPYIFWQQEIQLLQQPDEIVILYMDDHHVRRVRLNGQHPAHLTPSWSGDSVGHYEGDTLVIDTVGVKAGPFSMMDNFGTPQSEAVHVVERYRLIGHEAVVAAEKRGEVETLRFAGDNILGDGVAVDPDEKGNGLQLEFTVEDPNVFTTSWSALRTYRRAAGEFVERVCAENLREAAGPARKVPTADKPDF